MDTRGGNRLDGFLARALAQDEGGGTTLEWSLLLAAIALPGYYLIQLLMNTLVGYYQMMTAVNSLPFP